MDTGTFINSSSNTTVTTATPGSCYSNDTQFKYSAYTFTYILVFPVAFLCNIGALAVFLRQNKFRNSASQVVMINLAISDWCFSLTLPLRLAYYIRGGIWDFPDWLCRLYVYAFYVNLYSSILLLTLLSFLRWLAVAYPMKHSSMATTRRIVLVCLGIWVFVAVTSVPFLFNGVVNRDEVPRCFEPGPRRSWSILLGFNYVGLVFGFLVPFFTIIFCYSKLIRRLTTSPPVGNSMTTRKPTRNKTRAVHLVSMVIATFLLCFLPYHLIRTLHLHAKNGGWSCRTTQLLESAVAVTLCMAACNCMVNPLLYYYSTTSFRKDMRDVQSSLRSSRGGSLMQKFSQSQRKQSD
ncbi:cysteinyl leukotriene receptor 1 isoform X2 [Nothobranchius furzeri]|uniref:cysteinyl leukotriene receptor 1 isoform X2 n=1 Tax=Nothobranchius furzeri TaxID=105023 RepID=UPI0024048608|nr:cysteinyl leukotriene receptor 1 isoform X2 [Nothobranchius furzeri]